MRGSEDNGFKLDDSAVNLMRSSMVYLSMKLQSGRLGESFADSLPIAEEGYQKKEGSARRTGA